jgi:hypothetical protein
MTTTNVYGLFTNEPTSFHKEWCVICAKQRTHEGLGTVHCCVVCGLISDTSELHSAQNETVVPLQITKYLQLDQ